MIPAAFLLITSFFLRLIIFIACSLKDSQNFLKQFSALQTFIFFIFLNEDIVDIEKPDGIYLFSFVVEEYSVLFFRASIFCIIHSRSA